MIPLPSDLSFDRLRLGQRFALAALVVLASIGLASPLSAEGGPAGSDSAGPTANRATDSALRIGDKLRVAFYEKFGDDEGKWSGRSRAPNAGFHQFVELCGEYVIDDDGTLSLPILGRFPAAGHMRDGVIADVTRAFTSLVGRDGVVNIISTEHQPVFVVGAVKNPGAFKFWQGMTVLHAVALAGGPKVVELETWQRVESAREMERLQTALDRVKRLLVRTSLLQAEGGLPTIPVEAIKGLVGNDATTLTSEEQAARKLTAQTRTATENAMSTAVDDARNNVKARTDRLGPLDSLIAGRLERAKAIAELVDRDTISRPVLVQTQSELADAQDRKRQAVIEIAQSRDHLTEAEHDLSRHRTEVAVEVARTMQVSERGTEDAVGEAEGALNLVRALAPKDAQGDALPRTYEVVRRSEAGITVVTLPGTATLEPGDLVQLTQKDNAEDR